MKEIKKTKLKQLWVTEEFDNQLKAVARKLDISVSHIFRSGAKKVIDKELTVGEIRDAIKK